MNIQLSNIVNTLERFKREFIEIASIVLIFSIFGYFLSSDVQFQFERLIGDKLAYFSPQEAFLTILKISFLTGLFLSFPLIKDILSIVRNAS